MASSVSVSSMALWEHTSGSEIIISLVACSADNSPLQQVCGLQNRPTEPQQSYKSQNLTSFSIYLSTNFLSQIIHKSTCQMRTGIKNKKKPRSFQSKARVSRCGCAERT